MKPPVIDPPNSIQLEPAEGCTLACSFCAIQSIRDNGADRATGTHGRSSSPFRFMSLETAEAIAMGIAEAGWTSRIEFAMHGEPTANRLLPQIVAIFRSYLPHNSIMVTSNGSGFVTDGLVKMQALFDAGLNTLVLDDYKHGFLDKFRTLLDVLPWQTFSYPENQNAKPHERYHKQRVIIIHDISENDTGTHQLTNQGGCSGGPSKTVMKRCAKPFREMSVRWDGNVAICCDDWTGRYKIGNVNALSMQEIWMHDRMEAARRMLYAGDRRFGPCAGCDVKTYRNGLLPDRMGATEMPAPDGATHATIQEALKGAPYTIKLSK